VDTVREWIEERRIDVRFEEYSFLYGAFFELTAESVRRYACFQGERLRKERAEYLAGVMHQLRTPLSSLVGQVELLASSSKAPRGAALGRLRRSLERLRLIADGVLRTERYDASDLPVRALPVEPARLVEEIVADHSADAQRKGIVLRADVSRALRMRLDPGLFIDAIGNLIQNAVKYTVSGAVTVTADEEADAVVFRVRDTGPGIAPEVHRRLFREVQPGAGGGAGIGLRIAHRACVAQGGEMGVVSVPGQGAEFWVRLPRTVASRGHPAGEDPAPAQQ
jgi:signal transduction histidine kinase